MHDLVVIDRVVVLLLEFIVRRKASRQEAQIAILLADLGFIPSYNSRKVSFICGGGSFIQSMVNMKYCPSWNLQSRTVADTLPEV